MKRLLLLLLITMWPMWGMDKEPSLSISPVKHIFVGEKEVIDDITHLVIRYQEILDNKQLSKEKHTKAQWKLSALMNHPLYAHASEAIRTQKETLHVRQSSLSAGGTPKPARRGGGHGGCMLMEMDFYG